MFFGILPKNLKPFGPDQQRVLTDLIITETHPGPILHDMRVLLDMLIAQPFELSTGHRLSLSILSSINEQMHMPIALDLKRPQQKSYPPILGLYLLLRASGLTHVDESGKKSILMLVEDTYKQWQAMNTTERYGLLLEAWLLRGNQDIIGERGFGFGIPDNFYRAASFYGKIPDDGLPVAAARDAENTLRYQLEFHNLGLMHEFGLIRVEDAPPKPGQGWNIQHLYRTAVGDALFAALFSNFFNDTEKVMGLEFVEALPEANLQDVLKPYFADWGKRLNIPEAAFREGVFTFRVTLGSIWRRIEIGATCTLDELAHAILNSVDFDHDHLYEFTYRNRFGSVEEVVHPYMEEPPTTTEVLVGDLPLSPGRTMTFLFDFGDNWEFGVMLEKISPGDSESAPQIVEAHGEAPQQYPYWDDEDWDDE